MVTIVGVIISVLIGVTCLLAVVRIVRGPSILDRLVGNEILTASIICGLGAYVVLGGSTNLLVILLALAIFSSAGSISVARYVTHTDRHAANLGANTPPQMRPPTRHETDGTQGGADDSREGGQS